VGAGLAGTLLTRELTLRGVPVTVLDAGPARRASSVPGALLHAHPGRSLRAGALEAAAFPVAWQTVMRWAEAMPDAVWTGDMIRPLVGHAQAHKLARDIPDHLERLDADQLRALHPALAAVPAVRYAPAAMIDLPAVLDHDRRWCADRGAIFTEGEAVAIAPDVNGWRVDTSSGHTHTAAHLILCCGTALGRWLPTLDVRISGGQIGVWAPTAQLDCAVSGGAHIAPNAGGQWVGGSTYLRAESWDELDALPEDTSSLTERLAVLVPSLAGRAPLRTWRGCRISVGPDRISFCGAVPDRPNLWALGGLGSRGLLLAPYLARTLAQHVLETEREGSA
jgi:tRNA 5-methylaminomethyl-2-thiouridine biosynthesis bifunctional protein